MERGQYTPGSLLMFLLIQTVYHFTPPSTMQWKCVIVPWGPTLRASSTMNSKFVRNILHLAHSSKPHRTLNAGHHPLLSDIPMISTLVMQLLPSNTVVASIFYPTYIEHTANFDNLLVSMISRGYDTCHDAAESTPIISAYRQLPSIFTGNQDDGRSPKEPVDTG